MDAVMARVRRCVAWCASAVLVLAATYACQDPTGAAPSGPTIQQRDCSIDLLNLPGYKGTVYFTLPTKCPVSIPAPSMSVHVDATVALTYGGDYVAGGSLSEYWSDQGGRTIGGAAFPKWSDHIATNSYPGDTLNYIQENGYYVGGDSLNNCAPARQQGIPCEDKQEISIQRRTPGPNGQYTASILVHLPYQPGASLSIDNAPGGLSPGDGFELHAAVHTPFIAPPVRYQWTRDGQVVSTDTVYADAAGDQGNTSIQVGLQATDANGTKWYSSVSMPVYAGCGTQLICSRAVPMHATPTGVAPASIGSERRHQRQPTTHPTVPVARRP